MADFVRDDFGANGRLEVGPVQHFAKLSVKETVRPLELGVIGRERAKLQAAVLRRERY